MKPPDPPIILSRCLLAGLFTGLIIALIVVIFNVVYRNATDLIAYAIVMPVSIFLAFPLINLIAGGIYFLFIGHLRKGRLLYTAITLLVTAIIAFVTELTGPQTNPDAIKFRGLLFGLELIEGLMAAFLIPFFAGHPKLYLTDKDIRGEE